MVIGQDPGQAVVLLSEVAVVEIGKGWRRRGAPRAPHHAHQVFGMSRSRNRMQHGSVDPAENRAVGADGNSQHHRRRNRESEIPAQLPHGKACIPKQSCHSRLPGTLSWGTRALRGTQACIAPKRVKAKILLINDMACARPSVSGLPVISFPPACPLSNTRGIHLLAYYKAAYRTRRQLKRNLRFTHPTQVRTQVAKSS